MRSRVTATRIAPAAELWPPTEATDADYVDAFEVPVAGAERSAETWMRATMEQAPALIRWFNQLGWRFVLGFRPASSPPQILGWPIRTSTVDVVVLVHRSRLLSSALLLRRTDTSTVVWSTRVSYRSGVAAVLWPLVSALHRRIVPVMLNRAARARDGAREPR